MFEAFDNKMGKLLPVLYKFLPACRKFMARILFPLKHLPSHLLQNNSYYLTYSMTCTTDSFSILYTVKIKTSLENFTILIYHDINSKLKTVSLLCKHNFKYVCLLLSSPQLYKLQLLSLSCIEIPRPPGHVALQTPWQHKCLGSSGVVLLHQWPELQLENYELNSLWNKTNSFYSVYVV